MKFLNLGTKKRVKIKDKTIKQGFSWRWVDKGEQINLEEEVGKRYGFISMKEALDNLRLAEKTVKNLKEKIV